MRARQHPRDDEGPLAPFAVAAAGLLVLAAGLALAEPGLLPAVLAVAGATVVMDRRRRAGLGLQVDQIDRLRQAELALATAGTRQAAAGHLADQAIALLGAAAAEVIIEGVDETVRVTVGERSGSVFGPGGRMRLLQDDGLPCGSIAVSARADGRPYTSAQEHILDALAERVSSTLHRLSLFGEVQAERRTLADVVASSSDGIFSVGLDRSVRSWNPAMERLTGVPALSALGRPVSSVFRPLDEDGRPRPGNVDAQEVALVQLPRRAAPPLWLTCSWSPLAEGGYVVVVHDDTERKRLQDDKDGWIAQVGHELRTPLTPLKGYLRTLQRRGDALPEHERQEIYEVLLKEEQRLEGLVDSLLQATSVDAGHMVAEPVGVDWPALVEAEVDVHRRADPSRTFDIDMDPGIGLVVVDPQLVTRIVGTLLSNARTYSPAGSPVRVTSRRREDGTVLTTVDDHGPGVAPEDRERIFEKFTRLGDHLTRPQQGVGLGLYIARGAADELDGSLWVEDGPDGGARFCFSVPVAPLAGGAGATTGAGTAPARPGDRRARRRRAASATAR